MTRHARVLPPLRAAFRDGQLGLGMGVASALGYVFVVVLSRALGPGDFGGFSSLNNIGIVLAIPAGAFQVMFASRIARHGPGAFDLRLPLVVGGVACLLTIAASPVLVHVTRVDSILAPVALGLGLLPLIVNGALMGGLLGMGRIRALSLVYVATGLSRVLAAATASSLDLGLTGSLMLVVLSTWSMTMLLWWLCRADARLRWSASHGAPALVVRTLLRSNSAIGVLIALTTVDVVLARYLLASVESGEYALVSTLGRSPVWVTQFLALALIPALARSGSRRSILRAGGVVLGVCLLGTGVAAAAPDFWIALLGGSAYREASGLLVPYLALGTLAALAQVLVVAEMAQGRHLLAKVAWGAVCLQVALCLTVLHDSAIHVLGAAIAATGLVVVVGIAELLVADRRGLTSEPTPSSGTDDPGTDDHGIGAWVSDTSAPDRARSMP